jgi:two-component system, chemotaxis family, response regulator Rcp1
MAAPSPARLVLLLEPDAQHAQQLNAGLQGGDSAVQVVHLEQYDQAEAYLWQQQPFAQADRPDLILLNLRCADSQALLQRLKSEPRLRQIPVLLLSQREDLEQVFASYLAQGNCYILKSAQGGDLTAIAQQIQSFWLSLVTLPSAVPG